MKTKPIHIRIDMGSPVPQGARAVTQPSKVPPERKKRQARKRR